MKSVEEKDFAVFESAKDESFFHAEKRLSKGAEVESANGAEYESPKSAATAVTNTNGGERVILFALWLLVFSASSQLLMIGTMLPKFGAQLSISEQSRRTLVSAYALLVGVFGFGPVSDKFGRRKFYWRLRRAIFAFAKCSS
ncbi:MAG: hypothetical protein ACR2HG_00495 [Pyrinomonadaceae bacterium]